MGLEELTQEEQPVMPQMANRARPIAGLMQMYQQYGYPSGPEEQPIVQKRPRDYKAGISGLLDMGTDFIRRDSLMDNARNIGIAQRNNMRRMQADGLGMDASGRPTQQRYSYRNDVLKGGKKYAGWFDPQGNVKPNTQLEEVVEAGPDGAVYAYRDDIRQGGKRFAGWFDKQGNPKPGTQLEEVPDGGGPGGSGMPVDFNMADKLRDEYNLEAKSYKEARKAYNKVKKAIEAGPGAKSGIPDITLIYAYQNIIDPGSVVRESDVEMMGKAGALSDQAQAWWARLAAGGRLPPEVRADILEQTKQQFGLTESDFGRTHLRYKGMAERRKLNIEDVIDPTLYTGVLPGEFD